MAFVLARLLKGKAFAVLGPPAAGKTTFIHFLRTGEVTLHYEATAAPTRLNGQKVKLKEYELKVDDIVDLPGTKDFHSDWKKRVASADAVCYLFDSSRFVSDDIDYVDAVVDEMRHVSEWRKERSVGKSSILFFLIGTHLDQVLDYRAASDTEKSRYVPAMWATPHFQKLARISGGSAARCLAGSLADQKSSEQLVGRVISEVAVRE